MNIPDFEVTVHNTIEYIRKKYPNENNTMEKWLALIGEEFGELCMAINDGETSNVIEEGTQTIAAIYLMLEAFSNRENLRDNKMSVGIGSNRDILDAMLEGVNDICKETVNITDVNYQKIYSDVSDSIGGLLANIGISIAEQKNMLQNAKTPKALQAAIRLLAVTAGNLMGAGTRMLSWMANSLPQRDSCVMLLPKQVDSLPFAKVSKEGYEVHYQMIVDEVTYAILFRPSIGDFMVVSGYNNLTGEWELAEYGFLTFALANLALGNTMKKRG